MKSPKASRSEDNHQERGSQAVITHLSISNYRSIGEDLDLLLGPLTALVGPNGSGKSNITDAFRFLADTLRMGLDAAVTKRQGFPTLRRWSAGRPFNVRLEVTMKEREGPYGKYVIELGSAKDGYRVKREYAQCAIADPDPLLDSLFGGLLRLRPEEFEVHDGKWVSGPDDLKPKVDSLGLALPLVAGDARLRPLADAIRNVAIYSIFPDTLRRPQTYDPARPMDEHGTNWCSILKDARGADWLADLKAALGQVTGDIDDIKVTSVGTFLVPVFRHGEVGQPKGKVRERWLSAAQESDGTLRMAGIITALLQEPPLTLIGIEEPELTVHPGALPLLYDFLVQASERSQVLITTHSPDLLSLLKPKEVRVVERHEGITTVTRMHESQRTAVHKRLFTPGDLMRMEGLRQESADNSQIAENGPR